MKKIIVVLIAVLASASLAACSSGQTTTNGNSLESRQQQKDVTALENSQPIPHYNYSQLRQNIIELETALAKGVQGKYYDWNMGINHPIHECNAIGAPIPTTDQLSNPNQLVQRYFNNTGNWDTGVIGQMDPDGVYTGSSTGTWIMCVSPTGAVTAHYWEGEVQGDLGINSQYNPSTGQTQDSGVPTFHFSGGH